MNNEMNNARVSQNWMHLSFKYLNSYYVLVFVLERLFLSKTPTSVNIDKPQLLHKLSFVFTLRSDFCLSLWQLEKKTYLSLHPPAPRCTILRWAGCQSLYRFNIPCVFEADFRLLSLLKKKKYHLLNRRDHSNFAKLPYHDYRLQ